jgi:tRNA dimethylallyltransferase
MAWRCGVTSLFITFGKGEGFEAHGGNWHMGKVKPPLSLSGSGGEFWEGEPKQGAIGLRAPGQAVGPVPLSPPLPVLVLGGPTASGKSALAMAAAERLGAFIINGDAVQLYADLPILSAQPSPAEQQALPHALYGILSAQDQPNVAWWLRAVQLMALKAEKLGRWPLIVGGSGLYLDALLYGLADIPDIDPAWRQKASQLYSTLGAHGFHHLLSQLDPQGAARLVPQDRQRCERAWAVVMATQKPLCYWQERPPLWRPPPHWHISMFRLLPPRDWLYQRCTSRWQHMLQAGAQEEVAALIARDIPLSAPLFKALGARALANYLAGAGDLRSASQVALQETRNYAKRQYTWFRNRWPRAVFGESHDKNTAFNMCFAAPEGGGDATALAQKLPHDAITYPLFTLNEQFSEKLIEDFLILVQKSIDAVHKTGLACHPR